MEEINYIDILENMKKPKLHISLLLDRSGSMASIKSDTIGGVNEFIQKQKEDENYQITFSLSQFDHEYEILREAEDVRYFKELTNETFLPRGGTALRDAISKILADTRKYINSLPEIKIPQKVMIIIVTDGEENSSKEVSDSEVRKMIEDYKNDLKWEIIFLSSDIQATTQARVDYGFAQKMSANFDANNISEGYTSFTRNIDSYKMSNLHTAKCCVNNQCPESLIPDWTEIDLTEIDKSLNN